MGDWLVGLYKIAAPQYSPIHVFIWPAACHQRCRLPSTFSIPLLTVHDDSKPSVSGLPDS